MAVYVSPISGTRIEPPDAYVFVRGTTATFKVIFTNEGIPTKVDTSTVPFIKILQPSILDPGAATPSVIATIDGSLVPGQEFEYEFVWNIPSDMIPLDNYVVSYFATIGSMTNNFGDEYFTISATIGTVGLKLPSYATVDDIRRKKFNIDDYLPELYRKDLNARNRLLEEHLRDASMRLREELNLFKARSNSENYRLFTVYYTIWSILLASRGEDGSSVSDQNIMFWRQEWERILAQEKREGVMQGIPLGRG